MKYPEFTLYDYIFSSAYLILFSLIAFLVYLKNKEKEEYKYFLIHFYWKILMGFSMAYVYVYNYGGGDTTAYWQGADTLNNLFYESPVNYFTELFKTSSNSYIPHYFNNKTGHPPIWIYKEYNSWFVCKISSLFSFFSFNSYLTLNLFYSVLTGIVSWKFFLFLNSFLTIQRRYVALAVLFIPTVGFWCTGIMKDSITYSSLLVVVMGLFKILHKTYSFRTIFSIFIALWLIFVTRSFIMLPVVVPFFIILIFRLNQHKPFIMKFLTRITGVTIALASIVFFMRNSDLFGEFSSERITETANTIFLDFKNNEGYTGKRYDLGITELNSVTMLTVIPKAILTTIYRPFIWEAENMLMLINGLESSLFLILTLAILRRKKKSIFEDTLNERRTKDFIIFCVIFVLILAYFVGLTSGLFGVLSRMKAPILPFFLLFIFSRLKNDNIPVDSPKI